MTLVAHWKMNDNAASATVLDATGTYNGTYKSVGGNANTADHDVAGVVNNALDFVGDDDYVEIADAAAFSPVGTPLSISAWVYPHSIANFVIVSKGVYMTDGEWAFQFATNKLRMMLFDESVDNCYIGRVYDTSLAAYQDTWIHVVGTYDGGAVSSGVRVYLNGVRIDDTDVENATFVGVENLTHAVWIGRYSTVYSNGVIDNVMLFNEALTPEQVSILYNTGRGTEIPNAELDSHIFARRSVLSALPLRARY